jgi:hypothetical protein
MNTVLKGSPYPYYNIRKSDDLLYTIAKIVGYVAEDYI